MGATSPPLFYLCSTSPSLWQPSHVPERAPLRLPVAWRPLRPPVARQPPRLLRHQLRPKRTLGHATSTLAAPLPADLCIHACGYFPRCRVKSLGSPCAMQAMFCFRARGTAACRPHLRRYVLLLLVHVRTRLRCTLRSVRSCTFVLVLACTEVLCMHAKRYR